MFICIGVLIYGVFQILVIIVYYIYLAPLRFSNVTTGFFPQPLNGIAAKAVATAHTVNSKFFRRFIAFSFLIVYSLMQNYIKSNLKQIRKNFCRRSMIIVVIKVRRV